MMTIDQLFSREYWKNKYMKDTQFFHDQHNGKTYAVYVPFDASSLLNNNVSLIEVGIAVKHPDDQYNKKIGREVSAGRLEPYKFTLARGWREIDSDRATTVLYSEEAGLELTFTTSGASSKPYFVSVLDYNIEF